MVRNLYEQLATGKISVVESDENIESEKSIKTRSAKKSSDMKAALPNKIKNKIAELFKKKPKTFQNGHHHELAMYSVLLLVQNYAKG